MKCRYLTRIKRCNAYLAGINQNIETGKTPVEFQIPEFPKRPFTAEDIYDVIGYMGFSFAEPCDQTRYSKK